MKHALLIGLYLILSSSLFGLRSAQVERVSLIICGPGKEIYELEGHTALRLQFDDGKDISVNWGTFDFNSPNFIYRFVKGETDYMMAVYPFSSFYNQYQREGRWMNEYELNLSPKEMNRLAWLIDSTQVLGSPVYRYNYVKDNCATRPVDYIRKAIGRPVYLGSETGIEEPTGTFRQDMTYYHRNYPWYQFGIDLALGSGIDYEIENEEHYFAPVAMEKMIAGAYITDSIGVLKPLVKNSVNLLTENGGGPAEATPFYFTPLFVCWLFFLIALVICLHDWKVEQVTRWFHCLYYSLASLAGLLLTFLIFVSVHESTSPNWLYLWLNPLCLIGAVFIWIKTLWKAVFYWQILNFVALAALSVISLCGVQFLNPAFIPLIAADVILSLTWLNSVRWKKG